MLRCHLLLLGCLAVCGAGASWAQDERPTEPFDRALLERRAAELALRPHASPARPEGAGRERLTYDQYRAIRFDPAAAIWRARTAPSRSICSIPGFIFDVPVNINLVVGGTARRVLFTNQRFAYGPEVPTVAATGETAGYSGFRVRAPLNAPDYLDEFLVFQGASYFRAVAKDQLYGLSARGLAVRTARPEGEEFPAFTDFWIERPPEQAHRDRHPRAAAEPVGRRRLYVHGPARRRDRRRRRGQAVSARRARRRSASRR